MKTSKDCGGVGIDDTHSIFFNPFVTKAHRRAARHEMDNIITATQEAKKHALEKGERLIRVGVNAVAIEALKSRWLFQNTPEGDTFLRRMAQEAGIPSSAIRFVSHFVDSQMPTCNGRLWTPVMYGTFIEIRLTDTPAA